MAWSQRKMLSLAKVDKRKILVFDTETTGKVPEYNEVLQISIIDGYGCTLFNSYIKPEHRKSWPLAERINHISPDMVKDQPTFSEVRPKIQKLFDSAEIVIGYNVNYDVIIVEKAGIVVSGTIIDVMTSFIDYRKVTTGINERYWKLINCAEYWGYAFPAHNSLEDAKATLFCFNKLISSDIAQEIKISRAKKKLANQESVVEVQSPNIVPEHKKSAAEHKIRKKHQFLLGISFLLLGLALLYSLGTIKVISEQAYIQSIKTLIESEHKNVIDIIGHLFVISGFIITLLEFTRVIRRFPRWFTSKKNRLKNKFMSN